ncbi:hypothetical protein [Halopiger goleimassiliensis]|uniref:hypothetical protein n=1 Tax=Halopiger goleimassiliensis TaxID=1293048 RepID=UPI000677F130|nr:hypothetical protein [Halopiger goleimassiliensis]
MTSPTHSTTARRRKAVLFCPSCAHEGTADDDWLEIADDGVRCLVCPACGETIDCRSRRSPRPPAEAD